MVWVAVCDRDSQRRRMMGEMVSRNLGPRRGLRARVCLFPSARELMDYGRVSFGICLVNVEAPFHLDAGREIKDAMPGTVLVFYGKRLDPTWALGAYRAGAIQYLSHPVEERLLRETLDRALWEGAPGRAPHIVLNSTQGLVNLGLEEIAYAKSRGHRVTFHLAGGRDLESKCLRVSFGTVIAPLEPSGFLRCHDSYAVNLGRAARLTPEGVQLGDGTVVPVSTKKRPWVRETLKYIMPMG